MGQEVASVLSLGVPGLEGTVRGHGFLLCAPSLGMKQWHTGRQWSVGRSNDEVSHPAVSSHMDWPKSGCQSNKKNREEDARIQRF